MAEIRPFAAIRYDPTRAGGDLSQLLAPPYDVLDQGDKYSLVQQNERNIVAIDLPHVPPKSAGPAEAYEQSARQLGQWLRDGTLMTEKQPALYVYHQCFDLGGEQHTRRTFIARVRLQPFSEGSILPHEKTFGGPKEDRLALMKATRCQLSPIFGLYTDPHDEVGSAFATICRDAPDVTGQLEGVQNRMWIVTARELCDRVAGILAERRIYIADGHHRYGTALMYRQWVRAQSGGAGAPDEAPDHAADYVMFVLASMDDPGCVILPYHRALAGIELRTLLDAWSPGTEPCSAEEADVVLIGGASGEEVPLRFTDRARLSALAPEECEAWHKLDCAYLHRYLIDELLRLKLGTEPTVHYAKSVEDAREKARDASGVALLMNATPMAHLRAVSEAGGLMPQKSTYFYPKLATGLTINPLS